VAKVGNVAERLAELAKQVKAWFPLTPSQKHMSGRDLGHQEPTPSLRYRAAQAAATGCEPSLPMTSIIINLKIE